jgi:hypothetical protein
VNVILVWSEVRMNGRYDGLYGGSYLALFRTVLSFRVCFDRCRFVGETLGSVRSCGRKLNSVFVSLLSFWLVLLIIYLLILYNLMYLSLSLHKVEIYSEYTLNLFSDVSKSQYNHITIFSVSGFQKPIFSWKI